MPLANSIGCGKYDDKLGHWVNIYGPLMKYFHPFCWTKLWFSIKDKMGPAPVCWGCLTHNGHNWLLRANKMLRDSKDTINSHPTAADSWFTLKIKIYVIWILVNTTHLSTKLFYWTFSTSCLLSVEKTLQRTLFSWSQIHAKGWMKRFLKKPRQRKYTQAVSTSSSLAARLRVNGERMRNWRGNGERMRNWKERGIGDTDVKWRERGGNRDREKFPTSSLPPFPLFPLIFSHFPSI